VVGWRVSWNAAEQAVNNFERELDEFRELDELFFVRAT
jgi:hypothetical protein